MHFNKTIVLTATIALLPFLTGCSQTEEGATNTQGASPAPQKGTHTHADGTTHSDDHGEPAPDDTGHDEVPIGTVTLGELKVELAQGHGAVEAGKESHLVVKLPYSDQGETIVRAWIGTEDRTLSFVGKGEYAASHDDYDIHAMAPKTLPENTMWWIELEKPDGTKVLGSAKPRMN